MGKEDQIRRDIAASDFWWNEESGLPFDWTEGAFLGNGTLGCSVYFIKKEESLYLHVELGSHDVYDRRPSRTFWMAKQFDNPRLPIGALEYLCSRDWKMDSELNFEFRMHENIYDGCLEINWRMGDRMLSSKMYVCAEHPMIVIENEAGDIEDWVFYPADAISPRQTFGIQTGEVFRVDQTYQKNPQPEMTIEKNCNCEEVICCQNLNGAYRTITLCQYDKKGQELFVTIEQKENLKVEDVRSILTKAKAENYEEQHVSWWHHYYQISGMRTPDEKWNTYYWRQIYKLGSMVRQNSRVMDNQGPWLSTTPWPGTWWNLNVQLCYWPLYTSGRLEQAESLNRCLIQYKDDLIENVPEEYRYDSAGMGTNTTWNLKSKIANPLIDNGKQFVELGNLTWALHDCWLYYKMTMDKEMLRDFFYPLLRRSINYYLHFVKKGEDGKWHLPATDSPEYGEKCEDCNYDLSLLRWGCETLLECVDILRVNDEKKCVWEDICEKLVEYPQNDTGYLIGKNLPYAKSHRHFSHLMMHIPLYLVNRENSDSWGIVQKSLEHWFSYPEDILGFSYVGASLLCSAYKRGSRALEYLSELLKNHITVNTMYREAGPVMETPLAAAECLQQLVLQSWGGKIRVFPAMPQEWETAEFWRFAAQGGFRVSASYKEGKTEWIEIESLAGEPCMIETDMKKVRVQYEDCREEIKVNTGCIDVKMNAGEKIKMLKI